VINRIFCQIYALHAIGQRFKARNYNAYYATKYAVVGLIAVLIVASVFV